MSSRLSGVSGQLSGEPAGREPLTTHHPPLTTWPWAMVCGVALGLLVGQVQVIGQMLLAIGVLAAGISIGMDIERAWQRRDGRRLTMTWKGDEP